MKKTNNKGFSLVELIIVIAIMVILVAVIAPQYLKFVNNSRISTDVQTAAELATAIDVAIANGEIDSAVTNSGLPLAKIGLSAEPTSRYFSTPAWKVTYDLAGGVTKITLNGYEVYPNPESNGGMAADTSHSGLKR